MVAAALVRDGRVLAQQRAFPREAGGRWELPGGRVEPGESMAEALIRECREELAVQIVPGDQLGPDVPLPGGRILRVHRARLAQPSATPVASSTQGCGGSDTPSSLNWTGWTPTGRSCQTLRRCSEPSATGARNRQGNLTATPASIKEFPRAHCRPHPPAH